MSQNQVPPCLLFPSLFVLFVVLVENPAFGQNGSKNHTQFSTARGRRFTVTGALAAPDAGVTPLFLVCGGGLGWHVEGCCGLRSDPKAVPSMGRKRSRVFCESSMRQRLDVEALPAWDVVKGPAGIMARAVNTP